MKKLKIPRYIQWLLLSGIIFLVIMTLLRLALVLSYEIPSNSSTSFVNIFFLGFRYDVRDVCIACLLLFLIGTIGALHPFEKKWGRRISFIIWTILIIGFALFYIIDFANYGYLAQRLRGNVLNFLEDAKISFGLIWENYHVGWILIGILIIVAGLLALVRLTYNIILSRPKNANKASRITWGIVFFLVLAFGIFGRFSQYPLRWSDAFAFEDNYAANIALNPFQSFFSSLEFRHATYDTVSVRKAYPFMAAYLGIDTPDINTLTFKRTFQPQADSVSTTTPNVVIVICESFSAYKSSMYGNPLNTTPYFADLCKKGIFFNRCFTPSFGTARGIWATITGVPDVDFINTSSRNPAAVDQHTIVNDFTGYDKYYFIGGSASWANIRGMLNNIKGLHLYEQDDYNAPKLDVWGVSDKNVFLGANKVFAAQKKPFIAFIQTADNHRPYSIPDEDKAAFKTITVSKDSLKKYGFEDNEELNAFRYTDFCYKTFIEAAEKEPYFKNTIFVFVGDHGITGDAGDMFPHVWTDELANEHVPLLFYAPYLLQPKEYSFLASQIDALPTAASLCKIPYTNTSLGRNLLDAKRLAADSGKNNTVFIVNPNNKRIGVINNGFYFSYGADNSSPEKLSSITNNNKIILTDSLRNYYHNLTSAFYETARYLLQNNKKK